MQAMRLLCIALSEYLFVRLPKKSSFEHFRILYILLLGVFFNQFTQYSYISLPFIS
jgi:hypothetical protein